MAKRWVVAEGDEVAARAVGAELGLHPLAARVLVNRGFNEAAAADRFLHADLNDLPDPFLMRGMDRAVERLVQAIDSRESISCYGDYDVDGVTSTALLTSFLEQAGAKVSTYTPHRLVEGYGLNEGAVAKLADRGVRIIVSLDCGITSVAEVAAASRLGVETIVVDHHTVPVELPAATAILNPHQLGCAYPSKLLAAVGVTFCLVMALRKRLRERGHWTEARPEPNLRHCLDLDALGTIAEVVPLLEVNRIFVRYGLKELAEGHRPGIRALKRVAGIVDGKSVSAGQVGFRLGPRVNAAGRLDDAGRGVRMLLTKDPAVAEALADELDRENRARQEIEKRMVIEAIADAAAHVKAGARGLVLSREGWHPGVVGIVASRVVERFHRPAVLIGMNNGVGKGSGRSIEGFHLYDALAACQAQLVRFGGHKHAAGVTLEPDQLSAFRARFEGIALEKLSDEDLVSRCRIEGRVELSELDAAAADAVETLAPFGAGHAEPLFAVRGKPSQARTVGPEGTHLKLSFSRDLDGIAFGMGESLGLCAGEVDAAVSLGFDDWSGAKRLQLRIKDLRGV